VAPETGFIVVGSVVLVSLVWLMVGLTRHFAAPMATPVTAEWLDEVSSNATEVLRVIDGEDPQTLRAHLPRLKGDFKIICMAVRAIIVESKRDRPDLGLVLVRSQITFAYFRCQLAWSNLRSSLSRP
jgi:hypothetical protein